jgi:surface polysaccharide O-acyltransferase-like enzyme
MLGMLVIFALFLLTFSAVEASRLPTHKRKLVIAAVLICACFFAKRLKKTPYHDSALTGNMYYGELMQTRIPLLH